MAFYAHRSNGVHSVPGGSILMFDTADVYLGEGYNVTAGSFSAFTNGYYCFILCYELMQILISIYTGSV